MSRPEKPIDWDKVDYLLECGCLGTEIAPHFDLHPTTFYARVEEKYGMSFTNYSTQKKAKGDAVLRQVQFECAVKDKDKALLIWLGKQRIGQREPEAQVKEAQNLSAFNLWLEEQKKGSKTESENKPS